MTAVVGKGGEREHSVTPGIWGLKILGVVIDSGRQFNLDLVSYSWREGGNLGYYRKILAVERPVNSSLDTEKAAQGLPLVHSGPASWGWDHSRSTL